MSKSLVPKISPRFRTSSAGVQLSMSHPLQRSNPFRTDAVYSVSKGAVVSLTRTAALSFEPSGDPSQLRIARKHWTPMASSIRVQTGGARVVVTRRACCSERTQPFSGEEGTKPWDIARAVAFFASADARWITGQHLVVDGGDDSAGRIRPATSRHRTAGRRLRRRMKFSIGLPRPDAGTAVATPEALVEIAQTIESAGLGACQLADHPFPVIDDTHTGHHWTRASGASRSTSGRTRNPQTRHRYAGYDRDSSHREDLNWCPGRWHVP